MSHALAIGASAGGIAFAGLAYAITWPSAQFFGPAIWRGPANSNRVAITFDDGPTLGSSERVLDALARHKAPASFFVIGGNVESAPQVLQRMDAEGHLVGNHSFTHAHLGFFRGPRYWADEVARTNAVVESVIGKRPEFFRPPLGAKTSFIAAAARQNGLRVITWSLRAIDGVPTTAQRVMRRFAGVRGGDILVMHDGSDPRVPKRDRSAAAKTIEPLMALLRERGLEPVRLDQLLSPTAV